MAESRALVTLQAGSRPAGIVPTSFDECYRLAQMLAQTSMAGAYKGKPEDCCVAIMQGLEVGLAPLAAISSIAVINGRAALWGDGALSVVQASGLLESFEETSDGQTATCRVKRHGNPHLIVRSFSMDDAKRASLAGKAGPWSQYPQRMLQMRARSWALRDGFADVLRGLHVAEESSDAPALDITPPPDIPDALPVTKAAPPPPAIPDVPDYDDPPTDKEFIEDLDAALGHCKTEAEIRKLAAANVPEVEERGLEQPAQTLVDKHIGRVHKAQVKPANGKTAEQVTAEQAYVRVMSGLRGVGTLPDLASVWKAAQAAVLAMPDTWQKELTAEKDRLKTKLQQQGAP